MYFPKATRRASHLYTPQASRYGLPLFLMLVLVNVLYFSLKRNEVFTTSNAMGYAAQSGPRFFSHESTGIQGGPHSAFAEAQAFTEKVRIRRILGVY